MAALLPSSQIYDISTAAKSVVVSTYLLDGHHNLNGIQAVQAEVVGKVRSGLDLFARRCSC